MTANTRRCDGTLWPQIDDYATADCGSTVSHEPHDYIEEGR